MFSYARMSIFDLDHTLLRVNSSFHFGLYLLRHQIISLANMPYLLGCYGLHKSGWLTLSALHESIFKALFRGQQLAVYTKSAADFIAQKLDQFVYLPAIAELRIAQQRGDFVAILSNSPDFLVSAIASQLSVTCAKGSIYALDSSAHFSHISFLMQGQEKAQWLNAMCKTLDIAQAKVTAYTDSILDLPLLLAAGKQVAVNPDRQLRALCQRNRWKVI